MARIAGVDLPKMKRIDIALTYIYGIGRYSAIKIIGESGVDPSVKVKDLTEDQVASIREVIDKNFKVEGDLRKDVAMDIKRLMDLGSYRGLRHRRSLPVRGQRTHTNSRTRKGPRKSVIGKKREKGKH